MKDQCQRCGDTDYLERIWVLGPVPLENLELPIDCMANVFSFRRICAKCRADFAQAVRQWFGGMPMRHKEREQAVAAKPLVDPLPSGPCDWDGCEECARRERDGL